MNYDMRKPDDNTTIIAIYGPRVVQDELAYYLLQIYNFDLDAAKRAAERIIADANEAKKEQEEAAEDQKQLPYRLITKDGYNGITPHELLKRMGVPGLVYLRKYAAEHKATMGQKGMDEIGRAYRRYCQRLPEIVAKMHVPVDYSDFLEQISKVYKINIDPVDLLRRGGEKDDFAELKKAAMEVARAIASKNKA